MKFITTKSETSLADLTHHVFDIKGSKSAAAKEAQAILREANPHLADLTKLPAGTLVIVPDAPGVNASASQSLTVSQEVVAQLKQALVDAKAVLEQSVTSETREIETSVSLARSRDLIALAKQAPELQQRLPQIAEQAKLQLKQIEATKAVQLQGLAQLEKDLGGLTG
jgi:Phage Tail Protein X